MPLILASCRGLLGGWLFAMAMPLLLDTRTFALLSAAGLHEPVRVALAIMELLGAALFAFDGSVAIGFVLLFVSFIVAAAIHVHHGDRPWWLAAYAVSTLLLYFLTVRLRRQTKRR